MKLSKSTLEILKNFSSINSSILFRPGNTLRTITPLKQVVASAKIQETFDGEAAIYDLSQFLGTLRLFSDPEIEFGEKSARITDATGAVANYTYASKEAIVAAPDKDLVLPSEDVTFTLEEKTLTSALKAAAVMGLPNVSLIGRGDVVYLSAINSGNATDHSWEQPVGKTDFEFQMIYRLENLKFLPRDYEVAIAKKLITRFASAQGDVVYYTSAETGSKFN